MSTKTGFVTRSENLSADGNALPVAPSTQAAVSNNAIRDAFWFRLYTDTQRDGV